MENTVRIAATSLGKQVRMSDGRVLDILSAIDMQVNAGEAVAILGPSGSGKSTLLGLLAGLDQPSQGRVSLLGRALGELDEDARAALRAGRVGFVFQSFQLLPGMTALENVALPLQIGRRRNARGQAEALLHEVGLGERLSHLPRQLSGGEQQRVALARAFAGDPQVLFADEPTGNLDADSGRRIIDLLFGLRDRVGCTLLLVTHDQQLAARCDRVLQLDAGRLVDAT
ncbi:MAG: ATP-binding cassette domain-containing protein [Chromatiaceae bacterium]|nr:ATP-binding cassette domain-containing protein [Chromatiaceae bacterium]MCP5440122.1 ATP-binding cassette domain-containing protein [Chromatiaceae bacterium]HPE79896.1 ATP-binding cassette domain-containing protein [Gammaproteobacteria bacterium]